MKRRLTIVAIAVVILAGLMYAGHTIDLFGIAQRMHGM
jgi:uncharacterized membrane protein YdcZ (DUF606 family)